MVGILAGGESAFSAGADLARTAGTPTELGGPYGAIRRRPCIPLSRQSKGWPSAAGSRSSLRATWSAPRGPQSSDPETAPGLITTCGGLFRGWQSLPLTVAKRLVLTGRRLSARGAYELSLVNTLTRDGEALARALELAAQACENSPFAVGESLFVMQDVLDAGEVLGLTQTEAATDGIRASRRQAGGGRRVPREALPDWRGG